MMHKAMNLGGVEPDQGLNCDAHAQARFRQPLRSKLTGVITIVEFHGKALYAQPLSFAAM